MSLSVRLSCLLLLSSSWGIRLQDLAASPPPLGHEVRSMGGEETKDLSADAPAAQAGSQSDGGTSGWGTRECAAYYFNEKGCSDGYCWKGCGGTSNKRSRQWCWTSSLTRDECAKGYIRCNTTKDCINVDHHFCCGGCGKTFYCGQFG